MRRTDLLKHVFSNYRRPFTNPCSKEYAGLVSYRAGKSQARSQAAIILLFAHHMLDPTLEMEIHNPEMSQYMAYADDRMCPIFGGYNNMEVNLPWVLHVINFFRSHFLLPYLGTMWATYTSLDSRQRPRGPDSDLVNGARPIGRRWNGTYSYLDRHDVLDIRSAGPDSGSLFDDRNLDKGDKSIQKLVIDFPESFATDWPEGFEQILHSLREPSPRRTRAQHRGGIPELETKSMREASRRFIGTGYDDEDFFSQGFLNPLPSQNGVPGFQRITMMKYFEDGNPFEDALWAYEGVVLPGSKIIVGRWWSYQPQEPENFVRIIRIAVHFTRLMLT
ncbi:hypothetical protein P152DRAFT_267811 [Eremomyces bilateralis CBS 781.70]|uniref:Uncharacterized protein n=1 Tax=Eremomyces bilateralis CBS 781.70 TaxID=1392243 RepID=A0A6G1G8G0_9PEZI|nr:uncharacterized protein P152DRAFT_267811 [Eremomyces bilateralis CBS 781.70]KAF1814324.1 hypothetical protein P152DRAFT_267811 [Eremomyces bilateralis CBS 781.70]